MARPEIDIHRAISQWTPGIKPTWTTGEVRSALRSHAQGDFSRSALLVDSMGEDDLLSGVREKRVDAVLGSEFCFDPVDAPNRQLSVRIVTKFEPLWWDMFPESELSSLIDWYRMLGVAVAVIDWEITATLWKPRLRVLHPQFLWFHQQTQQWIYNAREGQLVVSPGDGRWVLLTDGERGWMRGAVRALAITWIAKQYSIRDWNRYNERHGLPIILAKAPAIADDDDKDQFWDDIKSLGSETVASLPTHLNESGAAFDLGLLEAKDNSWQSFKEHLDRCDRRMMIHMLGSNLSTEVKDQGSFAATNSHRGVERAKAEADSSKLSTELRRQALYPAASMNVPGTTLECTPWPRWKTEPPEDIKFEADAKQALGAALKGISDAGYDVDNVEEVGERYGLELVKAAPVPVATPLNGEAASATQGDVTPVGTTSESA